MTYEWTQKPYWGKQKPPVTWEAQVINDTLLALEGLTRQQEDEIEKIAKQVTEKFLERVSPASVKNCFSRLHKAIRIYFSPQSGRLTPDNSYSHPTRQTREHIGCLLIDTPDDIKAANQGLQRQALDWKQHSVTPIDNPEAIVDKGREMLERAITQHHQGEFASYLDLSVSLALLAGLRAGEILRDAVLEAKSDYTVMLVSGQAKTRGQQRIYEMPTLIEASTVLEGYQILRETFNVTDLNDRELEPFKNKMRFHVIKHFSELVPTLQRLNGEKQVNLQRLRAVYDTIAVFYYCPPPIKEFVYIKAINGHEPTPGRNDAAMYYLDYQIADSIIAQYGGQRQGVKLGQKGVKILDTIADKLKEMEAKPSKSKSTSKPTRHQTTQSPKKPKIVPKPQSSPKKTTVRVSSQVKEKIVAYQEKIKAATQDEALMRFLETAQESTSLKETEITPEVLGLNEEWQEPLKEAMSDSGETNFKNFVIEAVKKEIKFRLGLRSRHEGKDFSTMPLSELKRTRHLEASNEKLRRAFLAIKHHNSQVATEKLQRWYINANTLHQLVGGRYATVTPWIEAHKDEIESHNQAYELTEADNRKPIKIDAMITVPEWPVE